MDSRTYWEKRIKKTSIKAADKSIKETNQKLIQYYEKTMKSAIADFESLYNQLLAENGGSFNNALEAYKNQNVLTNLMLSGNTLTEIQNAGSQKEAMKKWANVVDKAGLGDVTQSVTANKLYSMDRYWRLQSTMKDRLKELGDNQESLFSEQFEKAYLDVYHSIPLKGYKALPILTNAKAKAIAKTVWNTDGKSWSSRLWTNTSRLQQMLEDGLRDCVIKGATTSELKKRLIEEFGVSYNASKRIVVTEITHIQTQATAQRYSDAGVKKYEFLDTEDEKTCPICMELNGEEFSLDELMAGDNAPPVHPNCRCTIIPVVDMEEGE